MVIYRIQRGLYSFDIDDHHAALGIPVGTKPDIARKQYMRVTRVLHPDTRKVSESQAEFADKLLSKFVNPAGENLFKNQNLRREHMAILTQIGKRLAAEGNALSVESDAARELLSVRENLERMYFKLMRPITAELYSDLDLALERIATISELNLVFLARQELQPQKRSLSGDLKATPDNSSGTPDPEAAKQAALIESYVRRARGYLDSKSYVQAVKELRDAIAIDKNNADCHTLLGTAYLKQKQYGMARVHLKKALATDPDHAEALQAMEKLERQADEKKPTVGQSAGKSGGKNGKAAGKNGRGGLFGLFGGRK